MKMELLSVILLLTCLLIIGLEYVFHYRLAEKQDEQTARKGNIKHKLDVHVEGVLFAPTENSKNAELKALSDEVGGDYEIYEMAKTAVNEHRGSAYGDDAEARKGLIARLDETVDPVSMYAKMLEEGNVYHKGYACRRLSELGAEEYKEEIRKCAEDKNRDLSYNAAMALCGFGDTEEVTKYILSIENDRRYSGRMVNEFFAHFTGSRKELAERIFEKCNPYMKCTVIKTITPYKIEEFRPMYIEGAGGNDNQMKIACVKALAAFGNPEDEQLLQIAAKEKDWVIRAAAVSGLSRLNTDTALESVKYALGDKEWWVRHTAAQVITRMDISSEDIEEILGGYDRFAADAVKSVLYKTVDTEE